MNDKLKALVQKWRRSAMADMDAHGRHRDAPGETGELARTIYRQAHTRMADADELEALAESDRPAIAGLKELEKSLGIGFFANLADACGNSEAAKSIREDLGAPAAAVENPCEHDRWRNGDTGYWCDECDEYMKDYEPENNR